MIRKGIVKVVIPIVMGMLITACGSGGGGGGNNNSSTPSGSSDWDTMVWDQDDWA